MKNRTVSISIFRFLRVMKIAIILDDYKSNYSKRECNIQTIVSVSV